MEATILIKNEETGREINLSSDDYELIAAYVREKDRIDFAKDVLLNHLSCENKVLENIENSIMENDELLEKFSNKLEKCVYEGSGEKEYWCVDELKQELKLGIYEVISNKGTVDEQTDKVVLTKKMAENLQNLHNFLITCDAEYIDPAYISSVTLVAPYED